jgi:hypothetical protein
MAAALTLIRETRYSYRIVVGNRSSEEVKRSGNNVTNNNSEALVGERTILTERPPLVGEVNTNFSG